MTLGLGTYEKKKLQKNKHSDEKTKNNISLEHLKKNDDMSEKQHWNTYWKQKKLNKTKNVLHCAKKNINKIPESGQVVGGLVWPVYGMCFFVLCCTVQHFFGFIFCFLCCFPYVFQYFLFQMHPQVSLDCLKRYCLFSSECCFFFSF